MRTPVFRHEMKVDETHAGRRLDTFLLKFPFEEIRNEYRPSRVTVQKWIADGQVRINAQAVTVKSYRLKIGDTVDLEVEIPEEEEAPPPEALDVRIVYRDSDIVVVDKPPGISSHPVKDDLHGSVVNFLINERISLPPSADPLRPGIVHRLDKNTSGLMVVACSGDAKGRLIEMIKNREVQRDYLAIVYGALPLNSGTIDAPIGRREGARTKMVVTHDGSGKPARTHYWTLTRYPGFTLIACRLDTGRTHQIRVHMSHIGYPVAGDPVYAGRHAHSRIERILKTFSKRDPVYATVEKTLSRIAEVITGDNVHLLHAGRLRLPHPMTGEMLTFTTPPHEKFALVMSLLETLPHEDTGNAF